jgi:hypothetical protein
MASLFTPPYLSVGAGLQPADGALLNFYVVGSGTRKDTFTTAAATVAHANPVVADALGVFPAIYLVGDYDWVLTDKNAVQKNTGLASEFATPNTQDAWLSFSATPTQASTTTFTVAGDETAFFQVGRRIKAIDASDLYGTITARTFSSVTTVTVLLDSGVLSASLSAILVGITSTQKEVGTATVSFWDETATGVNRTLNSKLLEHVSGEDKGADNTGVIDATSALLEENFTPYSQVYLGDGLFKMNKWMEMNSIRGNGYSTQIQPFSLVTNDGFSLSLGYHPLPFGAFDLYWIKDLAMDGKAGGCIRFDDQDDVDGADLNSVAWLLENLTLRSLGGGTCVKAEYGTIGNSFNSLNLVGAGYHYWLQNNQFSVQHTGANTWNQGHHQRADFASIYINDNQQGRGNWVFNEVIFEKNAGFGIFAIAPTDNNIVNFGALTINNCWFESNGVFVGSTPDLTTTVEIDGVDYLPQDMRFESIGNIVINGSAVKQMEVVQSDVACYDCRHDGDAGYYSVIKDKNSTINLTNPSGGGTMAGCDEWSHTAPASISGYFNNRSPMLRMAHRSVRGAKTIRTSNSQGLEKTISGNYTFTAGMSAVQVADGLIYDTCIETTTIANTALGAGVIQQTATDVGGMYYWVTYPTVSAALPVPTVSGITAASPAVVSATAHGYSDNQLASLAGVAGMTELNGKEYYLDKIDNDSFSLRDVDSSSYTAWSSGGTFTPLTSFVVMTVATKVISGKDNITSIRWDNGVRGGVGSVRHGAVGEWVTTVCMINQSTSGVGFPGSGINVVTNAGGSAVVRFCDFQVAAFPTKQEASDFIHSGIFEYTP